MTKPNVNEIDKIAGFVAADFETLKAQFLAFGQVVSRFDDVVYQYTGYRANFEEMERQRDEWRDKAIVLQNEHDERIRLEERLKTANARIDQLLTELAVYETGEPEPGDD